MANPHYTWWRIWEEDGKDYAIPHDTMSPQDARRLHSGHSLFGWAETKARAHVSPLTFHSDEGAKTIAPAAYNYLPQPR